MPRKVASGKKPPPKTSLGFQDDKALATPGPARDALLAQMAKMGAKDVRYNVLYGKTAGGTDLHELDSLVDAAKAHGLRVQATLMSDPKYAKSTSGLTYQNNDPKLWTQFAQNVASREKGRVGRYSIGNEMNHPSFLAGADKDSRAAGRTYRNIYRAGYQGVKGADKGAQVLLGEITSGGDPGGFLKSVLAGKPIKTAGLALHPYDLPGVQQDWDINHLSAVQKLLAAYKRQGKLQTAQGKQAPLYLTEMGYQRGTPNQVANSAAAYRKAQQAGAREFLQYQLTDKQQPATAADAYGQGGSPGARPAWDTSVGTAGGDLSAFARALAAKPRAVRKVKAKR
jgi:hypothetical protein